MHTQTDTLTSDYATQFQRLWGRGRNILPGGQKLADFQEEKKSVSLAEESFVHLWKCVRIYSIQTGQPFKLGQVLIHIS